MDLLDVTEMSIERTWKVSAVEVQLGGMLPDTASLFHITHDLYLYDLMTLLKNFCTHH